MRTVSVARSCLLALLVCATPVLAEEPLAQPVTTHVTAPAPLSMPEMFVAAQKAETIAAIANMRARLAELVPFAPRSDSISEAASDYANHWDSVVENFADVQMGLVDALIVEVNQFHQEQIHDFMTADHLDPGLSLFDDPAFMDLIQTPIDFANPLPTEAGFFGS